MLGRKREYSSQQKVEASKISLTRGQWGALNHVCVSGRWNQLEKESLARLPPEDCLWLGGQTLSLSAQFQTARLSVEGSLRGASFAAAPAKAKAAPEQRWSQASETNEMTLCPSRKKWSQLASSVGQLN